MVIAEVKLIDAPKFPSTIIIDEEIMSGTEQEFLDLIKKHAHISNILSAKTDFTLFSKNKKWGYIMRSVIFTPDDNGCWKMPSTLILWNEPRSNKINYMVDNAGPLPKKL